jgi:hypothetical protein
MYIKNKKSMDKKNKKPEDENLQEKEVIKQKFVEKRQAKKKSIRAQDHHRRPSSIGGTDRPSNISYIPGEKHNAWHILVGNMNAYQIAEYFDTCEHKPQGIRVICTFINGTEVGKTGENNSKNIHIIRKAWRILFADCENFEQIIAYVNNALLDPAYHLYLQAA